MHDRRSARAQLSPEQLNELWSDLAGPDADRAFRAVWATAEAAQQTLPFLRDRLRPIPPVDGKQIVRWVADLDSNEFKLRQKANKSLEELEESAEPALRDTLGGQPSAELRQRVEQLLQKINTRIPSPQRLQALRAIEVLEHMGTPEAKQILQTLANGVPEARITQEAKASLEALVQATLTHANQLRFIIGKIRSLV